MICHVFEQCLVRLVVLAQLSLYVRNQQGIVTRGRRLDRVFQGCGHRRRRRRLDSRRLDDRLFRNHCRHFSNRLGDGRRRRRYRLHHSSRLFSDRHWLGLWRYRLDRYRHFSSDGRRHFSSDGRRHFSDRLCNRLNNGRRHFSSHNRLGLSSDGLHDRLDDGRRLFSNRLGDRCRLFSNRLDGRLGDRCRLFSYRLDGHRLCNGLSRHRLSNRLFSDRLSNGHRLFSDNRLRLCRNGLGHRLFSHGFDGRRLFSHRLSRDRLDGGRLFSNGHRLNRHRLFSYRLSSSNVFCHRTATHSIVSDSISSINRRGNVSRSNRLRLSHNRLSGSSIHNIHWRRINRHLGGQFIGHFAPSIVGFETSGKQSFLRSVARSSSSPPLLNLTVLKPRPERALGLAQHRIRGPYLLPKLRLAGRSRLPAHHQIGTDLVERLRKQRILKQPTRMVATLDVAHW